MKYHKPVLRWLLTGCAIATFLRTAQAQPGSVDTSFNAGTGTDGLVYAVAVQPDGKVLIGGSFTSVRSTTRKRIARLNSDGTVDSGFDTSVGANDVVYAIAVQADGKVLIGGAFSIVNGTSRSAIARLNANGTVDTTFDSGFVFGSFPTMNAIALLPDGRVVIGGSFSGTSVNNLAVLAPGGAVDNSFVPDSIDGSVQGVAVQPDGRIVVAGYFTQIGSSPYSYVGRLTPSGSLDATFNPISGPSSGVDAVVLQADGKIIIGGEFSTFDGTARNHIARINTDGTLDNGFTPGAGANDNVLSLALQPDGKIFLGGFLNAYNNVGRGGFARLNANGGLDLTFDSSQGVSGTVRGMAVQTDGKLVIGGGFPFIGPLSQANIARVFGDSLLQFSSTGFSVLENAGSATISVSRVGNTNSTVTVNFATSNLTAIAGADYSATNGTLSFTPGQTTKSFSVAITNDGVAEFNESFTVRLSNPSAGARLGVVSNATVAIIETNLPGTFQFETNNYRVGESGGFLTLIVHRTGGGGSTLSVNFATVNGNALAPSDFIATNGTFTFAAADVSQPITVPIVDNWPVEGDEAFSVRLSSPTGGAVLGVNSNANVTIVDSAFSYEDLYGHMLRIEAFESVYLEQFFSSFSNNVIVRNPSPGTSLPGFVQLTSLDPSLNVRFGLPAIPGGGTASVLVGGPLNFAPNCPFDHAPIGSCTNLFYVTVLEPTTNGLVAQDSRQIFRLINTQPPTGGVPVGGGGGLPAPGFNPPPFVTNVLITGPLQIDEGAFADFSAVAQLSNGTNDSGVVPDWNSSAFQISSTGHFTTTEVTSNTPVAIRASLTIGGASRSATNTVTILNLAPPQLGALVKTNGSFGFTISGSAGRHYAIDKVTAVTNPPPWIPIATNVANGSGTIQYSEPRVLGPGSRFFRARRVP